ncbi:MAG: 50S ribosomal protein L29 [Patescibacteria group bacterium]
MKKKQKDDIKLKNIEELKNLIKESQGILFKLRLEKTQNKLKNLKAIFLERKKIALMLTIINEKAKLEKTVVKATKKSSTKR